MTQQEIFNAVWNHYIVLGNPRSALPNGRCVYHGPNGERCAVGVVMPEEAYLPEMDHPNGDGGLDNVAALLDHYGSRFPEWMHDRRGLLSDLQGAHDYSHDRRVMRIALREVAVKYALTVPNTEGES